MGKKFYSVVMKMFWNLKDMVLQGNYEDTKYHGVVHCNIVNLGLCKFHLKQLFLKSQEIQFYRI